MASKNLPICPLIAVAPLPDPPIVLVASVGIFGGKPSNNCEATPNPKGKSIDLVFSLFSTYGEPISANAASNPNPIAEAKPAPSKTFLSISFGSNVDPN
jgi:hypothetical protein